MMIRHVFFLLLVFISFHTVGQKNITLSEIWEDYAFLPERVPGFRFMNDGRHYTRLEQNQINKYDFTNGEMVSVLLDGASLSNKKGFRGRISRYSFSHDESLILISTQRESIYRRSSKAFFFVYNPGNGSLVPVKESDKVMYATFSPDGRYVAYVWDNDIYIFDASTLSTTRVTSDGAFNRIINGAADWVYEEEFSMSRAFEWSPDSRMLGFIRYDESLVPEFTMTMYHDDLYPEYRTFKYPKVGEDNAIVSAHIYNLEKNHLREVDLGDMTNMYLPRIKWTVTNDMVIFKMNRHQNHLQLFKVGQGNSAQLILDEKNEYYIDITDDITFLRNGNHFVWSSEKSGYNHLYLYDMDGKEVRALTKGSFDVTAFYGVDEKRNCIYYQAAANKPSERHVFAVGLDGGQTRLLTPGRGTHRVQFSSTFDYYADTHSTINTPPSYVVYENSGREIRVIEKNDVLKKNMEAYALSPVEFFEFKTSEDIPLKGWIIKPVDFDPQRQYPVFMHVYGGPNSQEVIDSWLGQNYWWFQLLAQNGYIVACVDNRGTGARGEAFRKMTYMNLGHYETIDQIEAARYLGALPYTDSSRIGIFGWSYGGYMSSLCILKGNDVFKAAIAVAPVTNWRWYDTIYTERYMRTEEENPNGYKDNSPVYFTDRLKGSYLLIHGMGDDNVHFQHSVEMMNALINSNKQFDNYMYPNRAHGIHGGKARLHLYTKMTNFILNNI